MLYAKSKIENKNLNTEFLEVTFLYKNAKNLIEKLRNFGIIFAVISEDGSVFYINTIGHNVLAKGNNSIIGKNWFNNYVAASEREIVRKSFKIHSKVLEVPLEENYNLISNDGRKINISWKRSFFEFEHGSTKAASICIGKINQKDFLADTFSNLTDREQEVLIHLSKGFSPKEISQKLDIQPKTIYIHKTNIYKKLNFKNHRELLSFSIQNKLIRVDDLIC